MLIKLTPAVYFINIFLHRFPLDKILQALTVGTEKLHKKLLTEKAVA